MDLPYLTAGLPGYEIVSMFGVLVPARTPRPLMQRLHRDVAAAVRSPEVHDRFLAIGIEPVGSSPEEFGAAMRAEMERLGKVIRDRGIRAQ